MSADDTVFLSEGERSSIADTYELPHEKFLRWWQMLDPQDRDEFRWLYQGDELLARFVCALDLLVIARVQSGDQKSLIQLAYHIAAKTYPHRRRELSDPRLREEALQSWNHAAVQSLLERVRSRSRIRERTRIENKVIERLDEMLDDIGKTSAETGLPLYDMKERKFAVEVALKFMQLGDEDQARIRTERTRKGLEDARKAALETDPEEDSPRVMEATVKAIASKLGKDKIVQMLTGSTDQSPVAGDE